jgi:hypothetical protein
MTRSTLGENVVFADPLARARPKRQYGAAVTDGPKNDRPMPFNGNLSVSDPGPVTPPTAQISTTPPKSPPSNSSGASAEGDGKKQ